MKHKEFNKRLSFRKTTISNLNRNEMNQVFGGDFVGNSNPCVFTPGCPPTSGCPVTGNSVCVCGSTTTTVTAAGI